MKLKILHLTQFLGVGGLEKVLFILIKEQLQAGHEVKLVVYDYEQAWVEDFRNNGIDVSTDFRKKDGYDIHLLQKIMSLSTSYDVIHTHDLNPLMYAAPAKLFSKVMIRRFPRLIHSAHGMDHLQKRPITKLYEKLCSQMVDKIVGVSQAVCDYYLRLGIKNKKICNIDNGILIPPAIAKTKEHFKLNLIKEFNLPETKYIWGAIARVLPLKNQKMICELAVQFPQICFLIVGPSGNQEYWNELVEMKPRNVIMTGPRSDISDILKGLDIFISASTHEGIPISVLEAGAESIPCVLSDIPGHKLIQNKSRTDIAHFFNLDDINSLIETTNMILNDEKTSTTMGLELHKHVQENFSSQNMYNKYLSVYLGQYV